MGNLSEESKDLLRQMFTSEAWRLYESDQQEQIKMLRVLAKSATTVEEERKFYLLAQGREDSLIETKDSLYAERTRG